ncbi:MAG TPA: hypothetical protein RMH99_24030 [Sandaracinaceae bacterium LLY-WYZ-13_1]|nr:hypothetical protein [Sandaracinaceae bacterium LLY-WYZ-13_1]
MDSLPRTALFPSLALCMALGACDGEPEPPDAGPMIDAGIDAAVDAGPPLTCTDVMRLEPAVDGTASVMLDTSMTETRPRDLGLSCGNNEAELRWAPQEVLEIAVPGSGPMQVTVDTAFPETEFTFNTVLQFRQTCEAVPTGAFPPSCFDDTGDEVRATGSITVEGGSTVTVIVTGYSEPPAEEMLVDEGPVRVDVSVTANARPTIDDGRFLLAGDDVIILASGTDAEGEARGVAVNFYDASGELVDIYGDGEATLDGDVFSIPFDPAPSEVDFSAEAEVLASVVNLGPFVRGRGIPTVAFRIYDAGWALSDPLMVDVADAELVGLGETCGGPQVCRPEMRCDAGTCAALPAAAAACDGAIDFPTIEVAADTAASASVTGTIRSGAGAIAPDADCADERGSAGAETIYALTVPDGTYDLLLTTDRDGTESTDTILYVRGACPDSGTELACDDDISGGNRRSAVQIRGLDAGTYHVFVERFGGLSSGTLPFELEATLRPVLTSGAACDDTEMDNRCASGACTDGTCP